MSALIPIFSPLYSMKRRWCIVLLVILITVVCAAGVAGFLWQRSGQRQTATGSTTSEQSFAPAVPDRKEAMALISGTMKSFAQGLMKNDFTDFYKTFSSMWKKQTTPEAVAKAFEGFVPFARDVQQSVTSGDPFINAKPALGAKDVLTLQGYYRIAATKMMFSLQYLYEDSSWKLLGMNLEVK